MMAPEQLLRLTVRPVLGWMAERHGIAASPAAERMLLAIAVQESGLSARRQMGSGPARGLWQFEAGGGVRGVLMHPATRVAAGACCKALLVEPETPVVHAALEQNDALACVFARLLLWSDPRPLATEQGEAWAYYLRTWRPGKPHPDRWGPAWAAAAGAVA